MTIYRVSADSVQCSRYALHGTAKKAMAGGELGGRQGIEELQDGTQRMHRTRWTKANDRFPHRHHHVHVYLRHVRHSRQVGTSRYRLRVGLENVVTELQDSGRKFRVLGDTDTSMKLTQQHCHYQHSVTRRQR